MSKKNKNDNEVKQEAPKSATKEIVDSIIVAFVIAIFIRTFFLGVYTIPSGSMLETLQIGDFILVNKLSYKFSDPKHDDIVVFEYPLNPKLDYIKRVIGVPGDVIEIKDKIVYRNGEKLDPDYVQYKNGFSFDMADNVPKFTVPVKHSSSTANAYRRPKSLTYKASKAVSGAIRQIKSFFVAAAFKASPNNRVSEHPLPIT